MLAKIKIQGIVVYTFIYIYIYMKEFTSFCRVLKEMHTKENWLLGLR